MWIPPQHSHPPCSLNINSIVICAQVILGYGRVWSVSVHQMYTSFSWETEGAFDVAFKLRQLSSRRGEAIGLGMRSLGWAFWIGTAYVVTLWCNSTSNTDFGVLALNIGTAFVVLVWCNRTLILVLEVRALRFGTQLGPVPNGRSSSEFALSWRNAALTVG